MKYYYKNIGNEEYTKVFTSFDELPEKVIPRGIAAYFDWKTREKLVRHYVSLFLSQFIAHQIYSAGSR